MFSISLRRSAAALGVVAGFLAAAVLDTGMFEHEWVKAPTAAGTRIGSEG